MNALVIKINEVRQKTRLWDSKKPEYLALIVFFILYCTVSAFHEPWFDEAQAWEIAKDASLREILLVIPHYEGHPPLWHLILAIPAKFGIPYETGLKTIGAFISIASAALILFRSKLPRLARLCIPFSFFFFYQYGVVTRPYGFMIFFMIILGMNLSKRKAHPWRIIIILILLCLCSAYGIVLSGGIALCLAIELLQEKGLRRSINEFFKDQRTLGLLALFLIAVILIIEMLPRHDTFYAAYENQNPFWLCAMCALLTFPAECFLTSASWFSVDRTLLQTINISRVELISFCIIGTILWGMILCSASKKNLKILIIPYTMLAVFSASVYFSGHHLGVVFMFFLFWAEYISREEDRLEIGKRLLSKIAAKESDFKFLRSCYVSVGVMCLALPIVWTSISAVRDIKYDYCSSKKVASFLKENGLDSTIILGSWNENNSLAPFYEENEGYVNTVMIGTAVPINAHLGKNVFFNLNHNDSERGFIFHRWPTSEESRNDLKEWRSYGVPDVIVGKPDLKLVYGNAYSYADYSLVALVRSKFIWKARCVSAAMPVFLRNDLLDAYGLEALEGVEYAFYNGVEITEEMRERLYNGESMEDILKPYLDVMFGEEK